MDCFKNKPFFLKNSKGQVTVEYILLISVSCILMQLVFNQIKRGDYFDDFVSGPNQIIGNMMENGTWNVDKQAARNLHPNQGGRHWSWDPL